MNIKGIPYDSHHFTTYPKSSLAIDVVAIFELPSMSMYPPQVWLIQKIYLQYPMYQKYIDK